MLKQDWSVLVLERRFLNSHRYYTEYKSRTEVVDKLLEALTAYEQALTHQAAEPQRVRYDLKAFERSLFAAIYTLHLNGCRNVVYEVVGRPLTAWQYLSEYQGWRENRRFLMNERSGKLRIREWEAAEVGRLMDGGFTVTFFDGFGDALPGVLLENVLPEELVRRFQHRADGIGEGKGGDGFDKFEDVDQEEPKVFEDIGDSESSDAMDLDSDDKGNKPYPTLTVLPQGKRRPPVTIRLKRGGHDEIGPRASDQDVISGVAAGLSEEKPAVVLRLKKSLVVSTVKDESDMEDCKIDPNANHQTAESEVAIGLVQERPAVVLKLNKRRIASSVKVESDGEDCKIERRDSSHQDSGDVMVLDD